MKCASTLQALPLIRQAGGGLLLMMVSDRNSVVKQISLLKMLGKLIRRGTLKVVVTSKLKHGGLFKLYHNHGVADLLEEPVHPRSIQIKTERHLNRLRTLQRSAKEGEDGKGKGRKDRRAAVKQKSGPAGKNKRTAEAQWKLGPALGIESDFWLARGGSGRRVMGRWMVRLLGPSPNVGRWVEIEGEGSGTNKFWQWTPNDPEDSTFLKEEGAWVFYGHRPEFTDDRWVFVGNVPRLSFYYDGASFGDKLISAEDGTLIIAGDSKDAERVFDLIMKSFERVIRAEQRKELEGDFKVEGEAGVEVDDDDVLEEDESEPADWNDEIEAEEEGADGPQDYVDEQEDAGGEINDLREDDEAPADWNTDLTEDVDDESPELYAEEEALDGSELEGEFSGEESREIRNKRRKKSAQPEIGESASSERDSADPDDARSRDHRGKRKTAEVQEEYEPRSSYRVAASEFSEEGGDWDFVRELDNGNRWYVFVDAELSAGRIEDAAALPMYWLYEGGDPAQWDEATFEWIFWDRAPRVHGSFDGLPKAVQSYLRELEPDEGERELLGSLNLAEEHDGEGEQDEPEDWNDILDADDDDSESSSGQSPPSRTKKRSSSEPDVKGVPRKPGDDEFGIEDEVDENDVKVVEIVQDAESKKRKKRADESPSVLAMDESQEVESDEDLTGEAGASESGFATAMRKRIEALGDDIPDGVAEALSAVEDSIQNSGIGAALELSKNDKSKKAKEGDLRGSPDSPGLSAMAMAFLLSELLGRVGMDPRWAAGRFCAYLSNSLGGVRVEIWKVRGESGWERLASGGLGDETDRGSELIRENKGGIEGVPGIRRISADAVSADVGAGSVRLLIAGEGAQEIPTEYLATLVIVLTGLVKALTAVESTAAAA